MDTMTPPTLQDSPLDRQGLRAAFFAQWDEDWLRSAFLRLIQTGNGPNGATLIGEGHHFTAWLMARDTPLPLVLKVAKPTFGNGLMVERQRWAKSMQRVRAAKIPVIPPFRILWEGEEMAIVSPYMPEKVPLSDAMTEWQDLETALRSLHLRLADQPCFGRVCGLVYLVDWSDLEELPRRPGQRGP